MRIIIPMTGKSTRFKKAGIETPKQFLKIENNFILKHIIDMFPQEEDINLIVSNSDFNNPIYRDFLEYYLFNYKRVDPENIFPKAFMKTGKIELSMEDDTIPMSRYFPRYITMEYKFKYKDDKEKEIVNLKEELSKFEQMILENRASYENILDKTTKSIEKFIETSESEEKKNKTS